MTTTRTPTPEELTTRTRVMAVEIDRAALATRAQGEDGEDELLPIAISSEYPVERYDWWTDERYLEVLDHSPEAIDLSRAVNGLPFLDSHNASDGRAQMGRVLNVRVEDGKLRGDVKFSRRQEAQDLRRDMLDGIRTEISVGYRIDLNNLEKTQADGERYATVRAKRWMPYEASSVSVPADPTVGVGRSSELAPDALARITAAVRASLTSPAPQAKDGTVQTTDTAAPSNGAAPGVTVTRAEGEERVREISALAEQHAMTDKLPQWIAEGRSVEEVRKEVIGELRERLANGPKFRPRVELTEKEEKEYSFARAILAADEGTSCFEREVSDEIERKLPQGYKPKSGFFMPTHLRAGLDSKTATTGQELKFVQPGSFIDLLRNKARVLQAGATMLSGLDGPVTFPKQNGAGTFSWVGENPGADVADSNLTLTTVSLQAKTGQSTTSFSRQLLRQGVVDVEMLVRNDLAAIHAIGIDAAALFGSGSSNQPLGIFGQAGVGIVAIGTNGGAPTYANMVALRVKVKQANADIGPISVITSPGIEGTLMTTQKFASSVADAVWGDDDIVAGMQGYSTNQVQTNLTKGTGTNLHAIYAGVWSQLLIGEWGAMEILTDPYRLKKQGMIEVTSFQMIDIAVRHAGAFALVKDAISAM